MVNTLPVSVQQAGSLLSSPLALQDATYRQMIIDWGRRQIAAEYPEDPIRAPLNVIRRKLALMEWEGVVRTNGRELRALVAGAQVRELQFQLQRREEEIRAQDTEARRQVGMQFDADLAYHQAQRLGDLEQQRTHDLLQLQHELSLEAEDAASRRRMQERIAEADLQIRELLIQAVIKTSGASTPEQFIQATQLVNAEISRIRHNPGLTPDEQHVQIKALLDTLPTMLQAMQATRG